MYRYVPLYPNVGVFYSSAGIAALRPRPRLVPVSFLLAATHDLAMLLVSTILRNTAKYRDCLTRSVYTSVYSFLQMNIYK